MDSALCETVESLDNVTDSDVIELCAEETPSNGLEIHPSLNTKSVASSSRIHMLPCSIEYDGIAPVSSFFHVSKKKDNSLVSHFRGRELRGVAYELPDNVQGICVGDHGNKKWIAEGTFSEINVWNHDTLPDLTNFEQCISWFKLANTVSVYNVLR